MRLKSGLALGSLGATVAVATFILTLQVPVSAMPAIRAIAPATIDRTLKGDRLPALPAVYRSAPQPELPEGCVAAVDWHRNIYTAEIAGRCVG